jgi:hypothetical protein
MLLLSLIHLDIPFFTNLCKPKMPFRGEMPALMGLVGFLKKPEKNKGNKKPIYDKCFTPIIYNICLLPKA